MLLIFNFAAAIVVHWASVTSSCPAHGYCKGNGRLTAVPDDIPPQASVIYLQDNQISRIEPRTFINNAVCTELRLEDNQLRTIRANTWEGLRALKYLRLGDNGMEVVEERAFSNLPSLKGLYLENNKLVSLSQGIFYPDHPSRLELILLENPLNQNDQQLCWIQRGHTEGWIINTIAKVESIECPPEVAALEASQEEDKTIQYLVIGSVALSVVAVAVTATLVCSQCRRKVPIHDKEQQKPVTVEIEPKPQAKGDRPLPALPFCKATALQPATQPFTDHLYNANPCNAHASITHPSKAPDLDSHGYLIPVADPVDLVAEAPLNEAPYSYTYQHRAARIKAFLKLQSKGSCDPASKKVETRERFSSADSDDYLLPVDSVTERVEDAGTIDPVYQKIE